ncbi:hypothetical protein E2562_033130 [Oryza meyeriana var. granulata]|uniref:DUF834 domain-containing protein n=1 Tax=Oryza meyeriana var. granulata TaxID=110450 RepID=A0A6G1CKK5_9ORYZ|nr:hypothetical protein E2562_033130 [Oryza meyeriana var. granulata]
MYLEQLLPLEARRGGRLSKTTGGGVSGGRSRGRTGWWRGRPGAEGLAEVALAVESEARSGGDADEAGHRSYGDDCSVP